MAEKVMGISTQPYSTAFLRKRRFLLVLPLLTVPFMTGVLWAVQRPEKKEKKVVVTKGQHGLNAELPGAHLKDDRLADKMRYYDEAEIDSLKRGEKQRAEAFYGRRLPDSGMTVGAGQGEGPGRSSDRNEERIRGKLAELNKVLDGSPDRTLLSRTKDGMSKNERTSGAGLEELEKRMRLMKGEKEVNPEMEEMNQVLDKLIRVQHPELLRDSLREVREKVAGEALRVERVPEEGSVSVLALPAIADGAVVNQFYDLYDTMAREGPGNLWEAILPETQILLNGATVKLALVKEVLVGGITVPAGTTVYGVAALSGERLRIDLHSIRAGDHLLPVNLQVYDQDGLEGIYIPGAIGRDVAKQSADQGLNGIGLGAYDQTLGGQATSAGIQLAKNMISRKVRLVRVSVQAGYRVWLKDGKQH